MNLRNYAYLGDAVWELFVREKTVKLTNNAKTLHKLTTGYVKASYQAELIHKFDLTDEEKELSRRARNLPIPISRRSNQTEYRAATAFETLIGWWYSFNKDRLNQFLSEIEITAN